MRSMASMTSGTQRAWLALLACAALGGCMAGVGDDVEGDEAEGDVASSEEALLNPGRLPCWATVPSEATASLGSDAHLSFVPARPGAIYLTESAARSAECPARAMITNGEGWSDEMMHISISVPRSTSLTAINWTIYGHRWDGGVTTLGSGTEQSVRRSYRVWDYARFEVVASSVTMSYRSGLRQYTRDPVNVDASFTGLVH